MGSLWNHAGIPHKGWTLIDVIDVRDDGQPEEETDYEVCMMCGNEKIRFVHILTHPDHKGEFRVGCTCAEKMTNDYVNPSRAEGELKKRWAKLQTWLKKEWKVNKTGNQYLSLNGHYLLLYKDSKSGKYRLKIDQRFGKHDFADQQAAKIALFKTIEILKEREEW